MNSTLDQFLGPKMNMIAVCFNTKWRKTEKNREYIASHFVSLKNTPSPDRGRLLDLYATTMIQHFSDVIWVEDTGHRTPIGQSGTFWSEPTVDDDDGDTDDLLEGLE